MIRGIVIKTAGDPEFTGVMVDGLLKNIIPLNEGEIMRIKQDYERLKAKDEIRMYGDRARFDLACKALDAKYPPEHHGWLYNSVIGVWALAWLCIFSVYEYMSAWNRE